MIKIAGKKFSVSFKSLLIASDRGPDFRRITTSLVLLALAALGMLASNFFARPGHAQQIEQVTISGMIRDNRGQPVADIMVSIDGSRRASTVSGSDGGFAVLVPRGGSYVVTPVSSGVLFAPGSLSFDQVNSNLNGINFTATRVRTFKVAGRIVDDRGAALGDVVVRVSDSPQILTITGPTGGFTFDHLSGGAGYTLTPTKAGFTFSPSSFQIPTLTRDYQGINFVAVPHDKVLITGTVTDSAGAPLSDVIVGLSGGQPGLVPTNSSGTFAFVVPIGGNYLIAPARDGYSFSPPSANFSNVEQNVSANFVGTHAPMIGISGYIVDGNGAPMVDVPVTITGSANGASPSGTIGNYAFSVLSSGTYTIIPQMPGVIFSPPSRTFTNLTTEQMAVNFVGTPGVSNQSGATPTPSPGALVNLPDASPTPEASPSPSPSPEESAKPTPTPKNADKKPTPKPGTETAPQTPQNPNAKPGPQDQAAVANAKSASGRAGRGRRGKQRRVARGKRIVKRTGAGAGRKRPAKGATKKRR